MISRRILFLPFLIACTLVLTPNTLASNTRVSITNYAWAPEQVHIDLDEQVTWDWLGPDLAHSVTGTSANARQWDSDPNTDAPYHRPGFSYTIQFTQPGTYAFECKLHPFVRGEVVVSSNPGDPNSGCRGPGTAEDRRQETDPEQSDAEADSLQRIEGSRNERQDQRGRNPGSRVLPNRRQGQAHLQWLRRMAGVGRRQPAHARRPRKRFRAAPGRYEAVLRATDRAANASAPVTKRFVITAGR